MNLTQSSGKYEANECLTHSLIRLHDIADMSRAQDTFNRIRDALIVDAKRLRELSQEMQKLSEAYNRYLGLRRDAQAHEDSSNALKALLGPSAFTEAVKSDKSDAIGEELEIYPTIADLRKNAPMWQHVQQYLRFVPEAQVAEIVAFFDWVGIKTSRQNVEAAIKSRPRIFVVKKRGRESFISLK